MAGDALYVDIYKQIKHDIQCGKYPENTPLPSEESLCSAYKVSRTTMRRALALLKQADMVYSVQGNGAYVKPHVFNQMLSSFYSFTDSLKSNNTLIQNKIVSCDTVKADKSLSLATGYPIGTLFHKLVRLRSAKEYPLMIETTYLPQGRFLILDVETLSHGSLYEFLRTKYVSMLTAPQRFFDLSCRKLRKKRCCKSPLIRPARCLNDSATRVLY